MPTENNTTQHDNNTATQYDYYYYQGRRVRRPKAEGGQFLTDHPDAMHLPSDKAGWDTQLTQWGLDPAKYPNPTFTVGSDTDLALLQKSRERSIAQHRTERQEARSGTMRPLSKEYNELPAVTITADGSGRTTTSHEREVSLFGHKFAVSDPPSASPVADAMDDASFDFSMTPEGRQLKSEMQRAADGITDRYAKEYAASPEYKQLAVRAKAEGWDTARLDEEAGREFSSLYGKRIDSDWQATGYDERWYKELNSRYGGQLAEAEKQQTAADLATVGRDIDSLYGRLVHDKEQVRMGRKGYDADTYIRWNAREAMLDAARDQYEDAQRIVDEARRDTSWGKGRKLASLGRGVADIVGDIDTWTAGFTDLDNAQQLNTVLHKVEAGDDLTPEQTALMDALTYGMAARAAHIDDVSGWYKAGEVTGESIPFILEMLVNPISSAGSAATKTILKYGLRRYGLRSVASASRGLARRVAGLGTRRGLSKALGAATQGTVGLGRGLASGVARGAGMAVTTGGGRVMAGAMQRQNDDYAIDRADDGRYVATGGDETLGESIVRSFASTAFENASEMSGDLLGRALGLPMRALGKAGAARAVGSWLSKSRAGQIYRAISGNMVAKTLRERAHVTGVFGEYLEEVYSNALNAAVGNGTWGEVVDPAQNVQTFLSLVPMQVGFGLLGLGGYAAQSYASARERRSIRDGASYRALSMMDMLDNTPDALIDRVVTGLSANASYTPQERETLVRYGIAVKQGRELSHAAVEMSDDDRLANDAYTNGQSISSPAELHDAWLEYLAVREEASGVFSDEDMGLLETMSPGQALQHIDGKDRGLALELMSARARVNGAEAGIGQRARDASIAAARTVRNNTNEGSGRIILAAMSDGSRAYVVSGSVSLNDDGSIDRGGSSESLVVRDASTGKARMADASEVSSIEADEEAGAAAEEAGRTAYDGVMRGERGAMFGIPAVGEVANLGGVPVTVTAVGDDGVHYTLPDGTAGVLDEQSFVDAVVGPEVSRRMAERASGRGSGQVSDGRGFDSPIQNPDSPSQNFDSPIQNPDSPGRGSAWRVGDGVRRGRALGTVVELPGDGTMVVEWSDGSVSQMPVAEAEVMSQDGSGVEPQPVGRGLLGNIYDQFRGKAKAAIDFLTKRREGVAQAALHHKDIGDIDLAWGNSKMGLEHIVSKHPDVLDGLQERLDDMDVVEASDNRVVLESNTHKAVVSKMLGQEKTPQWLLTAYEKKDASGGSSDIVPEPQRGKQNGTAPLQDIPSTGKVSALSADVQGRSLTSAEADTLIAEMEAQAETAPEMELTPANWQREFGADGMVDTPLGKVKMGENQITKLFAKGRDAQFGMIRPTLTDPDIIIEESSTSSDGTTERPSSYVFVKTFNRNGETIKFFASITVKKDGMEVSVSSHFMNKNAVARKMVDGNVMYIKEALRPISSEWHLAEHREDVPDLLPTQENNASITEDTTSTGKDTTPSGKKQGGVATSPIPRDSQGQPDYERADPDAAWDAIVEQTGGDEAMAQAVADSMVADKEAALKKAERAKPRGGVTIAEKIAAERDRKEAVERAKASLTHWQRIALTRQRRQMEAQAEQSRRAEEAARSRREQEERQRAELEEAERIRREALNGVPDIIDDTPQDARARGYRRVNGEKIDRQAPLALPGDVSADAVNRQFNDELQRQVDGTLPKGHIYRLGRPGGVLLSTGFPDLPIELSSTRLEEKSRQKNHPFPISDVKGLVSAINRPLAVFRYGNSDKSQNVIVELRSGGKNFLVGVHFSQDRRGIEVNDIRGLFPKDTAEWLNWITQGKLLYADKQKIQALIAQQRINLAEVGYLDLDAVANILKNFENPDISIGNGAILGNEVHVKFDDQNIPAGRVALIEASRLQPSHINGQRNPLHFIDEAQPKERNDEASVLSARRMAANIRPEEITSSVTAYTGAPTVNVRGEVIQGNNRSAALREMWAGEPAQAQKYRQYLTDHAADFGLTPEDVEAMRWPVLVSMVDVSDDDAITLGQFVAQDTESGGTERIKPRNVVQRMGGDMRSFASRLLSSSNDEMTFSELVDRNGMDVLKWMQQCGHISPTQYRSAFDNRGNLTAEAKNDLRGIMYQSIFQNGNTHLEEMFGTLPAKAQKAILATAYRDYDSPNAERMNAELQASISAYHALSQMPDFASAKNYREARLAAQTWQRQYAIDDVTGESYLPSDRYSNFAVLLAVMYKGQTQSFIQNTLDGIFDLVQGTQEATLFEQPDNTPRTLVKAINEAINARGDELLLNGKFTYDGQRRSNVLAGGSAASQQGRQGSTGDAPAGGRAEDATRQTDSPSGVERNGGQLRNDGKRQNALSEVSSAERAEMENRIVDWLSDGNLAKASGKSREYIFKEFGNEPMPIAYIPERFMPLVGAGISDPRIYCGKGSFIEHALRNHAAQGNQISVDDVDVSKYLNIQSVLDNPDHIKETFVDGKRTVVFIKKIGRYFAELTQVEENGKIILHKSLFNQKKEPYAKLDDIRHKDTSSEGGVSSISHADGAAPAISLQSRDDEVSKVSVWKHADDVSTASDVADGLYSSQGNMSDPATEGTDAPQTNISVRNGTDKSGVTQTIVEKVAKTEEETEQREAELASRVQVNDDDWQDGDGERPTYKRSIIIDGTHTATQIDEPDENGHYTGSYFEFDNKRFGDIAEIVDYIDNGNTLTSKIEQAEAETDANPTEAQKEAGNYKKGHVRIGQFNITVENPKGSVRRGTDANGNRWETTMRNTYGYIRGTEGVDGDHIDVFLTNDIDGWNGRRVYVVDQYNEDGTFDEHKVMLGFNEEDEARDAYFSNYSKGWSDRHKIVMTSTNLEDFEKWIDSSHRKTKPFAEYRSVNKINKADNANDRTGKAAQIEKLRNSKPVEITGKEIEPSDDLKQYRKNANEYGLSHLRGEYINKDTGKKISVSKNSIKEVTSHDASPVQFQSVAAIPQILENSIYIDSVGNEDLEKHRDVSSYDYYVCGLRVKGIDYTVKAVVANGFNCERYYDHRLTKIEKGELISLATAMQNHGSETNSPLSVIKDKRLLSILQKNYRENDGNGANGLSAEAHEAFSDIMSQSAHKVEINDSGVFETENTLYAPITVDGKSTNLSLYQEEPTLISGEPIVGVSFYRDGMTYQEASDLSEAYNRHAGKRVCADGNDDLGINFGSIDEAVRFEEWLNVANEPGAGFEITPAQYTTKRGKVLDMSLVKFAEPLSKEQQRAAKELAKAEKGWYDRDKGGFMMRSEESAQKLVNTVMGDEETVNDAQPLSLADMQQGSEPAMRQVDVEGLMQAINRDGEAKLSDHFIVGKPGLTERLSGGNTNGQTSNTEAGQANDTYGADNRLVSRARYEELKKRMRQKLGGQLNMGIDPDILAIGTEMAAYHIEAGARRFADYARRMIADLGDAIRPYLKSFYNGARDLPEVQEAGYADEMTPYDEVRTFDTANFDKTSTDALTTAETVVAEQEIRKQAEKAKSEIINRRNNERRKEDKQTAADTEVVAGQAEAVADEAERRIENATDEKQVNETVEEIDRQLDKVNEQLALLGYYEADQMEGDFNEAYGYMRNAEKKAVKDANRLANSLVKDLGIDPKTIVDKKGKRRRSIAMANIASIGGDISIHLPLGDKRELYINIQLDKHDGDNLKAMGGYIRIENPNPERGEERYLSSNNFFAEDETYQSLLRKVQQLVKHYAPDFVPVSNAQQEAPTKTERKQGKRQRKQEEPKIADLFSAFEEENRTESQDNSPFQKGDAVIYHGKPATVYDFDDDGRLVLDTGLAPVLYDIADPKEVKPANTASPNVENAEINRTFANAVKTDMLAALDSGTRPYRSILDLRKRAAGLGMEVDNDGRTDILLQELVEDGLVRAAREVVKQHGRDSRESYDLICKLYDMQPTIAARSSNRIKMQQYSTPLPMAWNAAHFAMSGKKDGKVLEPTAGNGMLVFSVPAQQVHANELDETRLDNLREQGFAQVTRQDAAEPFEGGQQYDVIIANPPFGKREEVEYDGKMIPGLDPQITLNALASMKDDGKAAIIIGGNMEYGNNGGLKSMKPFFTYLYDHYNVKGVVDMDGRLYAKQGTTYPTRMILIAGRRSDEERAQTAVYPPVESKAIRKAESFDDLYDIIDEVINSKEKTNGTEILRERLSARLVTGRPRGDADRGGREEEPTESNRPVERIRGGLDSRPADVLGEQAGDDTRDGRETAGGRRGDSQLGGHSDQRMGMEGRPGSVPTQRGGSPSGTDTAGRGGQGISGRREGQLDSQLHSDRNTGNGSRPVLKKEAKRQLGTEKLPYRPHNTSFSLESVAPAAMVEAMDNVLSQIEAENGNIDEFVRKELGYDTIDETHRALAAEQIDSVAMAICQMKKGQALIIGDQTGVGKGRQMAALIRWAVKRGEKPIFITQKADLFSDIYRDLVDIGSGDLVPFIFNDPSAKENKGEMVDSNGKVVYKGLTKSKMQKVLGTGKLPDEYDYAVLTYSQVNTGDEISRKEAEDAAKKSGKRGKKGKDDSKVTPKAPFLRAIAKGNYLFLDESHTAAGDGKTGAFMQSILRDVKAATFASATFAKRPDTMPLYAIRTAMSQAKVEPDKLIGIIEKGGVTLQEIMSRELTNAGQMVRRERDMSDVVTDWKTITDPVTVKRSRESYDRTIAAFNAIIKFQEDYVKPMVDAMDKELAVMAESAGIKRGTDKLGISNVPFASKTYNYTKQLMLALKVDAIANEVDTEIKAGRHPVIALESTMESSIKDYSAGEVIEEPTFSASLLRGLDTVMQYTIKDENGKEQHARYSPKQLGEAGEKAYYELQDFIRKSTSDIFISPLDAIIERLHGIGYKVGELTGRDMYVKRDDEGRVVVKRRTDKDKKKMQREFNNGTLDVLILNKSASTGISLHASEKFSDQRQRTMIIAQPLSDINDYMQMIGRIDRTGQVHRGYYINLGLPVPAENRFLMMLSTKLKSLNANTTTSQDSESNDVEAPDLLNKYGSQVVVEYLRDNPEIYEKMGSPLKKSGEGSNTVSIAELEEYKPQEDDARKITGYVALLTTKEQEEFYDDVVRRYNELIKYLNDTGSNDLKITVMPLRAKTLSKRVSSEGIDPTGTNPFARNSYVERVEMDVLRKPMKAAEIRKTIAQVNKGKRPEDYIRQVIATIEKEDEARVAAEEARYERSKVKAQEDIAKQTDKINRQQKRTAEEKQAAIADYVRETNDNVESKHNDNMVRINTNSDMLKQRLHMFEVGKSYLMPDNLESMVFDFSTPAIFCGYKAKDSKITASTTLAVFATLDGRRRMEVKLSQPEALRNIYKATNDNWDAARSTTLENWDSQIPTGTRKTGFIMTGNILQAIADTQDEHGGYPGQLISYTDIDGNVHDGILMPDKWNTSMLKTSGAPIISRLKQIKDYMPVTSHDGKVEITGSSWAKVYYLTIPKTKKDGAVYYEDKALLRAVHGGNFYPYRGKLRADITEENIEKVVRELSKLGVKVREDVKEDDVLYRNGEDGLEKTNRQFNEQLARLTEANADGIVLSLGRPSAVLRAAGVEDKPMKLYGNKVMKKMRKHGFTLPELRDLPRAVADPIAVFKNYGKEGNRSILTELRTEQGNFLVTLTLGEGHDVDFNIVTSVFGKGGSNIVDWINKGFATYINKEKALNYLHHSALKAVTSDSQELVSAANIIRNFENPGINGEETYRDVYRFDDDELGEVNERFNDELQQQIDGTLPKGHVYSLGRPSDTLLSAGLPDLPIEMAASRLSDKSMQENHPFELSEVRDLPDAIQHPMAVFRSATHIGSYVVMTEIEHGGKNFVVAIEANRRKGKIEVNSVRSVHYRTSNSHMANWIAEGLLEYADKEKMAEWLSKQRYNSADVRKLFNHAANIVRNFENPGINGEETYRDVYRLDDDELDEVNERFNEELRRYDSGEMDTNEMFHLGMPQGVMRAFLPDLPIVMRQRVAKKGAEKKHNVPTSALQDMPSMISDPIFVFQRDANTIGILTDMTDNEGKNVCVAIELGRVIQNGGEYLEVNDIRSFHGREVKYIIEPIAHNNTLRYANKEKGLAWLSSASQPVQQEIDKQDLIDSANIVRNFENPSFNGDNLREGVGELSDDDLSIANDPVSKLLGKSTWTAAQRRAFAERERLRMVDAVQELAAKLHLDNVEVVTDASTLDGRRAKAKGFYSRSMGRITIVIPNHTSVADVERTLLHEAVAHYGLRELFGEHFDTFLDNVFQNADSDVRRHIVELAKGKGWDFRTATEEYLASLAEETDFANATLKGWWQKIKELFLDMLHKVGFEGFSGVELSDNELRYILWRSYENLAEPGRYRSILGEAEDVVMQSRLKVGNYAEAAETMTSAAEPAPVQGDGGKAARIEKLRQSEPIVVSGNDYQGKYELNPKSATRFILDNLRGDYVNKDTGNTIRISRKGAEKVMKHDVESEAHLKSVAYIPQMIENAIFIAEETNTKGKTGFDSYRYYVVGLNMGGVDYTVKMAIGVKDGETYYDHALTQIEKSSLLDGIDPINTGFADKEAARMADYSDIKDKRLLSILQTSSAKTDDSDTLFREADTPEDYDKAIVRERYDRRVRSFWYNSAESMFDSMQSLKEAMQIIIEAETGGTRHIEEIAGYENAYLGENRLSSKNESEGKSVARHLFKPLLDEAAKLAKDKASRTALYDYMMAKHGLERNRVMALREAQKAYDDTLRKHPHSKKTLQDFIDEYSDRDFAGLTGLTGTENVAEAEAEARRMVDAYEAAHDTDALWARVRAVTDYILDKSLDTGLLSREGYDRIKGMYTHYIPLRGFAAVISPEAYTYLDAVQTGAASVIKEAGGRTTKADDPLAQLSSMLDSVIMQGNRNQIVKQRFLNFVLNHPSDLVSVSELYLEHDEVKGEWRAKLPELDDDMTPSQVSAALREFDRTMSRLVAEQPERYRLARQSPDIPYVVPGKATLREHQVLVHRGGRTVVLTINGNPRLAQALNGATNPDGGTGMWEQVLRIGESVNRQLAAFYTTRRPDFVLSNFMRDAVYTNTMAYVKEGGSYGARFNVNYGRFNPASIVRLIVRYEAGQLDESDETERLFRLFMDNGGETGYTMMRDMEAHKRAVTRALRNSRRLTAAQLGKMVGGYWDIFNRGVENCARFAAFVTSMQSGRSLDRSIWDAKEISVNFNKKGSGFTMYDTRAGWRSASNWVRFASGAGRSAFVFFNAALQGTSNFARATARHPVRAVTAMATMYLLGTLAPVLASMFGSGDDDDDYYDLPDFVRRTNWVIPTGGHGWICIPLPVEYRAIYGLGELSGTLMGGEVRMDGAEIAMEVASQLSQLMPINLLEGGGGSHAWHALVPSAVAPIVEIAVNRDWLGLPVYKDTPYNKEVPEWRSVYRNTNELLVSASRWLNDASGGNDVDRGTMGWLNPAAVEHLLTGYLGGYATTVGQMVNMAGSLIRGEEMDVRNVPLLNRVYKRGTDRTEARHVNEEYWKLVEEAGKTTYRLRGYREEAARGVTEYAERIVWLNRSPEYARYAIMRPYMRAVKRMEQARGQVAEGSQADSIDKAIIDLKRQAVEACAAVE